MNVFLLGLFIAGVLKLFQIHTVLIEIKDVLKSRSVAGHTVTPSPIALHSLGSGDEMLRAIDSQMQEEDLKSVAPH